MLSIPDKSLFPGTGPAPNGNEMPAAVKSQSHWLAVLKTHSCNSCHQLGNLVTRTISPNLGTFKTSAEGPTARGAATHQRTS